MDSREEFLLFSRYLVGKPGGEELAERYIRTAGKLAPDPPGAVLGFVHRHPWTLGPLDAASALLESQGALRTRLAIATAVLEATPDHCDRFLAPELPRIRVVTELAWLGIRSAGLVVSGFLLWPFASAGD